LAEPVSRRWPETIPAMAVHLIQPIQESEMVAAFLAAEIKSERHRGRLLDLLNSAGEDDSLIERADLRDVRQNEARARLLGDFRGYRHDRGLFMSFPQVGVRWYRALVQSDSLRQVRYVDYSYWNELSGGTRLPADAAGRIRDGFRAFDVENDGFMAAADAVLRGVQFDPPILVGRDAGDPLVVLEGHVRLTTYALVPTHVPDPLPAIIGLSPQLSKWMK
jgi:hypothetical protein